MSIRWGRFWLILFSVLCVTAMAAACAGSDDAPSDGDTPDGDSDVPDGDEDGDSDGDIIDGDEDGPIPLVECRPESVESVAGVMAAFTFEKSSTIFDAPWPNDWFRDAAGFVTMPGMENLSSASLIEQYVDLAESTLDGFSPNAAVYFHFDGALDESSLPQSPADSVEDDSAIVLVNVDEHSPEFGRRVPVNWHLTIEAASFEPANLLAIAPFSGFPLLPATTYAVVVTGAAKAANGSELGRPEKLAKLLSGCWEADAQIGAIYYPLLRAAVMTEGVPADIRAATVFTTSDPTRELQMIRDYVVAEYPNGELKGEITGCRLEKKENDVRVWWFEGKYVTPNFQQGEVPYASEGGGIAFGDDGQPIVDHMETINFALSIPDGAMPESGWPIVLISHGTGGDYNDWAYGNRLTVTQEAGLAAIGISQPLHGDRGGNLSDTQLETYSFNFLNPTAARSNFRQSAIDTFALTALLRSGDFVIDKSKCDSWPTSQNYNGPDVIRFDPSRILFHGHSQGGLTGSLSAAFEDDVIAWVLSGAGGKMMITIMERENPNILDLIETVAAIPSGELHEFHPLLTVVQMLVDITDPINYAPYWIAYPPNGQARNIMATSGFLDSYTPKDTAFALATAGRIPQVNPVHERLEGLELRGIDSFTRPAEDTVQGPNGNYATVGFFQYPDAGHFPIFDDDDAIQLYQEFFRSIAYDGKAVLGY